ncbi:uncharacterized protein [Oryza sativa Japonica Group]|uniref:GRF zinc finger family protein, expressed n=2 Tax=Oryza sativa subsp. japonica TaxID=39947 RepID=Q10RC4_ORYSJ|nr:uncharacterized protein LOC4331723 [Oryza sativa Japonica Group]KAB8090340.1 hypothetical protein EE612_015495 [Oryza sativa]ABF94139.1 GRF zinc finger family protein, expressed [Oryza sativa Japonica Group]KAF2937435.1 hypothetical protein DAI22_03g050200 [Oryza sativa Japonica Group]BAF10975.1 Os03g0164200 [Oryza sativa Japonica Group]BAG88988.1 unnamed protein product [Oryza sativa Japonica Group]|eukprot:NP_001049061.1 Os03g0164200 [Oryza sativa Japonica Group]
MVTSKKVQNNEAAMADGAVKEYRHGLCMDVPMYIEDSEYCGEELGTRLTCRHGLTPKRRTAWEGPDTGRRFLGCPLEEEDQCDKFFWVDEPWHPRVQKTLEQMWHAVERATKLTGSKQYDWCCFVRNTKAEEEKMKLELDTADHISELELAYKKN